MADNLSCITHADLLAAVKFLRPIILELDRLECAGEITSDRATAVLEYAIAVFVELPDAITFVRSVL